PASIDTAATGPTKIYPASDEFGVPAAGSAGTRYGWLGSRQRRTELDSGVIQMGVRTYVPAMGRFTSVDPVDGGSANDYDYANQDPVNGYDLDGRMCPGSSCQDQWPHGCLPSGCPGDDHSLSWWVVVDVGCSLILDF